MTVLLTRRAVVQVAMEASYGVAAALGLGDGLLTSGPTYTADPTILEREYTRDTLSPEAIINGRMMAKMEFTTELRGNGRQNSGVLSDAPIIARLFRACGYTLTGSASATMSPVFPTGDQDNPVAWVGNPGGLTNTDVMSYYIAVDTAGASGVARVTITSDLPGEGSASQAITSGTPLNLGTKGGTITPTFAGNLVVGQAWQVWLFPAGLFLTPRSTGFESITLGMYRDSVYHQMPGAYGTFEITAEAGKFASVKWTFTGLWNAPVDQALPSPTYEQTLPAMVELARLRADGFYAIVQKFTFNQMNDVQIREDVNSPQGYIGTRITGRKPEGGINPEADNVANYDFWGSLRSARRMPFQMRIGTKPGNTVWFTAPSTQYTKLTYTDRQGISTYDAGLRFSAYRSDDEMMIALV